MYEISPLSKIEFGATGDFAILQNARFLLTTLISSCPMDRSFGWEPPLDDPSELAKTTLSAGVIEMLERNIPEITVEEVTFELDTEEKLVPRVKVVINHDS